MERLNLSNSFCHHFFNISIVGGNAGSSLAAAA